MSYGDKEQFSNQKSSGPHPDCKENAHQLERMMKTAYMPNSEYEIEALDGKPFASMKISDSVIDSIFDPTTGKHVNTMRVTEYKNVTFVWGIKGRFKHSHPISFHTKRNDFMDELVGVLNLIKKDLT